jgi:hypothetical protein
MATKVEIVATKGNNQRCKAALVKAGLNICGYRLKGEVKKSLYLNF